MSGAELQQTVRVAIGVDVGGTFTDLVAWDGTRLHIIKIPSTPPEFHRAVIEAVRRIVKPGQFASIVHGSTVATNALLQRRGEPVAFVTTEGFRDMLLIGRQNRPKLYALRVERPPPITPAENWFTVRERIDARGNVVEALTDEEVNRLIEQMKTRGLRHVAVCLLFSFINPAHERTIGQRCEAAGLTVTLSCDVLPEFREYERASTTTINASLRPTVEQYLEQLEAGLTPSPCNQGEGRGEGAFAFPFDDRRSTIGNPQEPSPQPSPGVPGEGVRALDLRIMHSGGGTMRAGDAARHAARLVLSGPAGGVIGAAFVAKQAGLSDVISYDMGGTSTDVATVLNGQPQWTTRSAIDGLPIGLPMFEINTVGAGGGSIAYIDAGGALRVGPHSAGADPGPACYGRGGTEPTVTDANVVLGRILPDRFLGGAMRLDVGAAHRAVERLARQIGKSVADAALGIVTVVESNMTHAVRAVTSRRGHDPRGFALVSFGGAGGLHACGLADAIDISRVLVPPYCGVLSALGMVVAPPVVDVSQSIVDRADEVDDARLAAEFEALAARSGVELPDRWTATVARFADVRFRGQSHEVTVRVEAISRGAIEHCFHAAYAALYGQLPGTRPMQIVSLRVRREGRGTNLALPDLPVRGNEQSVETDLTLGGGRIVRCRAVTRAGLLAEPSADGPLLIIDAEATTYVPPAWVVRADRKGSILLRRAPVA